MRTRFDAQIKQMNSMVAHMGELCVKAIDNAAKALREGDTDLAEEVMLMDAQIDQTEREIERLCLTLLLQQQPVARDLRQISAALKMITDMERIGDQASDIAEIVISAGMNETSDFPRILDMSREAIRMVRDSMEAFLNKDLDLAARIQRSDDVMDQMFDEVRMQIFEYISASQGQNGHKAMDLIMIAKYLERIGDHATNIAEWVEYSITGVHKAEQLQ